eukprot:m.163380 g.163380  ORF g.163380 m.163380 type:complete len:286 (+) comp13414_c1_seq24:864-1721(+)
MGSSHPFHQNGDYDFTYIVFSYLPLRFSCLSSVLREHLSVKLSPPLPSKLPAVAVPNVMLSTVIETDNHLLMANGAYYNVLKEHQIVDGLKTTDIETLATFLSDYCHEILDAGVWQYNSRPYIHAIMFGLLILHDTTDGDAALKKAVADALDYICFTFALGCIDFKSGGPFRRQKSYYNIKHLRINCLCGMMMVWTERHAEDMLNTEMHFLQDPPEAIFAIASSYTPKRTVVECARKKGRILCQDWARKEIESRDHHSKQKMDACRWGCSCALHRGTGTRDAPYI